MRIASGYGLNGSAFVSSGNFFFCSLSACAFETKVVLLTSGFTFGSNFRVIALICAGVSGGSVLK